MTKKEKYSVDTIRKSFGCIKCVNGGHCRFGAGYDSSEDCGCSADNYEEFFEIGWDKAKSELLKEFKDWFCEPYCRFYGNEDYCRTCPLKKEDCWLKD